MKRVVVSKIWLVLPIIFILSTSTAWSITNKATPLSPIMIGNEGTATISFSRLIFRVSSGTKVGNHHDGLLRVHQYSYTWMSNISIGSEDFKIRASELMRSVGYSVLGGDNLLFGQDESAKAEYQLGATVTSIAYNTYAPLAGGYSECLLTVEWQLYDVFKGEVVYNQAAEGYGKQSNTGNACVQDAFLFSLNSILAQSSFVNIVKKSPKQDWIAGAETLDKIVIMNSSETDDVVLPRDLEDVMNASIIIRSGNAIGSGVIVSSDGWALTAAHVVSGLSEVQVILRSGIQLSAKVERTDNQQDVALIKLTGMGFKFLKIGNQNDYKIGSEIYAIGSPTGSELSFSVSKGIISGFRESEGKKYIQTDTALNPGNSGGPLVATDGKLIGIVSWKIVSISFEGLAFGVPVEAAADRLGIVWN